MTERLRSTHASSLAATFADGAARAVLRATFSIAAVLIAGTASAGDVVATVNGTSISGDDVRIYLGLRGVPADASPSIVSEAVDVLIDRELIHQFLERTKVEPDPAELAEMARQRWEARPQGDDANIPTFESLGVDKARLASELAVPLAWRRHVSRVTTEQQVRDFFEQNRQRLDGTQLRVSQIFRRYEAGESPGQADATTKALQATRDAIASGKTTFAVAARTTSQSPSAANGGDVGWIDPKGDLPGVVSDAAFQLKRHEVSGVIESSFGVHLVTVTDVRPGELSLEDVRPVVLAELSRALWKQTVVEERKSATIDKPDVTAKDATSATSKADAPAGEAAK